jgi:mannose-1-phosphate guanylyltransferase
MNNKDYCIIMAGGVGSRFWPLSRKSRPKQFLDITGTGKTLLQMTFERFRDLIPLANILIVTNAEYLEMVASQLPELPRENILTEPHRRNTAPCIAYAAYKILKRDAAARLVVAPSDHLIVNQKEFRKVIRDGLLFVSEYPALLTLGITPDRPETGYGYIQADHLRKAESGQSVFKKVKTFTEKPDLKMAKVFMESGEFFWNSGIFFWSVRSIIEAFEQYLPEIAAPFEEAIECLATDKEKACIEEIYSSCRSISIDYGIMEKAQNVYVLECNIGWSDLGTWGSLHDHKEKDVNNNALIGQNTYLYEVSNSLVSVPENKLVVIQGLENCIVVDSEDALLICRMDQEQRIRTFVNDVKLKKGDEIA